MDQALSALVAALVSILVVLLTRRSETIKHFQSVRTAAYVDFIRGIAGLAIMQRREPGTEQEFMKGQEMIILVADAKARIAIYGTASVVKALADFLRGGAVLDTPERAEQFTKVCQMMRGDRSYKVGKAASDDVHFLLFGLNPKDYLGKVTPAR